MITKGGLIGKKQEMTRVWHEGKQIAVTLVKLCDQEIIRYKTEEKDGYSAVVIGVDKKTSKDGKDTSYSRVLELRVAADFADIHAVGSSLDETLIEGLDSLRVMGRSKGKGFAGVMKRHNFAGGPATHGSKFHRAGGSTGNRKPRRTIRGRKMAGHMGDENITLRSVPLIDVWNHEGETFLVMKGSLPGGYNRYINLIVT